MQPILQALNVRKAYAQHVALDGVSLDIPERSIFGLLGPNGAGKTSLIRIITQITAADEGEIRFRGERLKPAHIAEIGYLPEERGLYKKMKVGEQLLYLARLRGMSRADATERIKAWLTRFDIKPWAEKNVEDLSKGMQQKVQFIATVLHEPSLIILDEPFSGFDPINANLIKDEILDLRERGATIIFSTHRMESVEEMCDSIALINRSHKVLDGPVGAIKDQFKTQTYEVEGKGRLMVMHPDFEVLEHKERENGHFYDRIRLHAGTTPNDLLRYLISNVEVHAFRELIPSINDIFIRRVRETMPESLVEPVSA
ncbi:ATP-binding cassette domain-containing protein [Hymenobacter sp. 5516J-16]|uniref:ATP-binding cassette domain-containing protein n=1 Tax=Hymenobacter sublimis TaxID=2933777 RepID=A0ABY4JET7_9BACT|nr:MULTISPECIES: ATP-binding cassette domain-containing protein [Hymenobacter]UOQ79161.1 ATP-binding cassette domain-containing protein [Hymenobacter sp. 5516J-16]UPL49859.1 ATP-binding cassette domain-containing protein [Hymenobacter sublimis]